MNATPSSETFLWHDYETTGISKQLDRPTQFAAVRTDSNFEIIDEPIMIYCKPCLDTLPNPYAVLLTGIFPEDCKEKGLSEYAFARKINEQFSRGNTCGVGYNSISFDDEMTRNLFYRNFKNPYEREYVNGNSRWDMFSVVKLFSVLRPEGIVWPKREDGYPSLKLEDLIKANNLKQERAHDALSDVYATIELAKFLKEKDPELFEYALSLRAKVNVAQLVNLEKPIPFIHMAPRYKNGFGILYPLIGDSTNKNSIICAVISEDISVLKNMDIEDIASKLYKKREDMEEGEEKIPLQEISINKVSPVAAFKSFRTKDKERLEITEDFIFEMKERYEYLANSFEIAHKVRDAFSLNKSNFEISPEPEKSLYGSFPSFNDKKIIEKVGNMIVGDINLNSFRFQEEKYNELLFRHVARNSFSTLSPENKTRWVNYCKNKLENKTEGTSITFTEYYETIDKIEKEETHPDKEFVVKSLREWGKKVEDFLFKSLQNDIKPNKLKLG